MSRLTSSRPMPGRLALFGPGLSAVWLLSGLFALPAHADIGPAGSGLTARASNASTAFWSPAGITRLEQPELLIGATLAYTESSFEVDESNIGGGDADNDTSLLASPSIYYAHPINKRWSLGATLTVPSGFGNEYGKDWSGRYLAEESDLAFVALAGTVGYRLNEQWSIGGGPIMMYTDSLSKARINDFGSKDGRIKLEEDGVGFGWQAGLMYEFSDVARIGMVYRAEIDPDLSGKPKFQNIGPVLKGLLEATGVKNQSIDVDFKVPEQVQLGYYQEFREDWSFTADAIWINMSNFGINHVSFNSDMSSASASLDGSFRDMYVVTTGLRYQYRPDLAFSVGGAYATSATSDARRTIALPLDRVIAVGAGVEWEWKGFRIHNNLNYADLGDGDLDQDNGLAGRVKGSFDKNYAVVLDTQIIWRF